ncbi:ribonuclease HII [Candidatus Curtissbacteria bacterium RIFCSPLOWO2_02_41_11]|uniref:Ribonuclease HII n=1 Tax=Candidatus Curtissbacteria bacterium RIFCSPLOWO2_02_41_11 TaxID=1797731 RepID=A0A1F5HU99_9BACT|nr:MAG: ribonuclease HII [Candidatus Curtissbacteria bacterium RIFCSPLOWO2_02_41_11]
MIEPSLDVEKSLWKRGYKHIAGIDEVGRGSWAGSVVAAAVILPHDFKIPENFGDSKQLKPRPREKMAKIIKEIAISWSIAEVPVLIINRLGIGWATQMAFRKSLKGLHKKADFVIVDAFHIKHVNRKNQKAIKKGDQKCATVAAASIIAKVYRDSLMKKLSKKYPLYGFGKHKGYGTRNHQEAIKKFGFCQIHRTSYNLNYLTV